MNKFIEEVASGNFYRWPPSRKRRWQQLTSLIPSIGIELELRYDLPFKQCTYLEIQGVVFTSCSSGSEITYLFKLDSIDIFYRTVKKFVNMLGNQRISTLGGLHVNIGVGVSNFADTDKKRSILSKIAHQVYSARPIDNRRVIRAEFKTCSPFITHEQLIKEMLIKALAVESQLLAEINQS